LTFGGLMSRLRSHDGTSWFFPLCQDVQISSWWPLSAGDGEPQRIHHALLKRRSAVERLRDLSQVLLRQGCAGISRRAARISIETLLPAPPVTQWGFPTRALRGFSLNRSFPPASDQARRQRSRRRPQRGRTVALGRGGFGSRVLVTFTPTSAIPNRCSAMPRALSSCGVRSMAS
jgi:hypothetical protein